MTPLDIPILGLALLFRVFVAEPFTIPSSSMVPTLQVDDYLEASKSDYGYSQFSLPYGQYLPAFSLLKTAPKRGDVVLFRLPGDPSVNYIKRVIGLAGDTVQVRDGIVYLNGAPLRRERIGDYKVKSPVYVDQPGVEYREILPDGKSYTVVEVTPDSDGDNTQVFTVPPGHCFVLGDNRDNSADSRFTIGYVPYANIFAKALITVDYSGKALKAHAVR